MITLIIFKCLNRDNNCPEECALHYCFRMRLWIFHAHVWYFQIFFEPFHYSCPPPIVLFITTVRLQKLLSFFLFFQKSQSTSSMPTLSTLCLLSSPGQPQRVLRLGYSNHSRKTFYYFSRWVKYFLCFYVTIRWIKSVEISWRALIKEIILRPRSLGPVYS